jgi:subtilase family serine protease
MNPRIFAFCLLSLPVLAHCGSDEPQIEVQPATSTATITSPGPDAVNYAGQSIAFDAIIESNEDLPETLTWRWTFGDEATTSGSSAATSHTYAEPGSYLVTLRVVDPDTGIGASTAATVEVLPVSDLDLRVPIVTAPSDTITPNDSFRLSVDISNKAASAVTPFDVRFYAILQGDLPTGTFLDFQQARTLAQTAVPLATRTFDSLPAGDQANIDIAGLLIPAGNPNGSYVLLAIADAGAVIGELDRSTNAATANRALIFVDTDGDGPDLLARDVVARPTRVNVLDSVTVSTSIVNVGTETALLFSYDIYLSDDRELSDDDILLARGSVDSASPNNPVPIPATRIPIEPAVTTLGEYFVLVQPDGENEILEADELNNTGVSGRIVVTDEPLPGIDISAIAFEIQPRTTFIDGTVNVTATIANQGIDPIDAQFFCRVHLSEDNVLTDGPGGDRVLTTLLIDPMAPASTVDVTANARIQSFFTEGTWFAFINCDPSQAIAEADEDNNVRVMAENVIIAGEASLNLRAGELSLAPLEVANGENVTVSVEVCNDGSAGSASSVVRVHLSADPIFDSTDTVLLQSAVPAVEPGQCATIVADVPATCDTFQSSYTVFAVADATGIVNETSEDDNRTTLSTPFVITGLVCSCENDRFEANNSIAQAAQVSATSRSYPDLTMCTSANDWYRIPLLRGESIRATATFDTQRGNLDMRLIGSDLSSVLSSSSTNGNREEVVFFVAPQAGDYYIHVFGRAETDRNIYNLDVSVSARASGTDILPVSARVVNTTPVPGQTLNLSFDLVNIGDTAAGPFTNWFYLSRDTVINPAEDIRVGELEVTALADRLTRTVPITLPISLDGGTWYLGVVADSRAAVSELDETNNTTFTAPIEVNNDCFDVFEPNNTIADARMLDLLTSPPVVFGDLLACTGNRDFFEVCAEAGDFITLTASFDTANGDIDLRLYDELGAQVDRSEGTTNTEQVGVDYLSGDRCYTLELYVAGIDRQVPYTLTVDTGDAPDELACSEVEEPNNNFGGALPLRNFFDSRTAVCPLTDDDYYSIALQAGTNVTFQLVPARGETVLPQQLRLAVFNPSRGFVSAGVSANEILAPSVAVTGQWFLRVRSNGDGPRDQPYNIDVQGLPGVDLIATDLLLEPGVAGPAESVRYSFTYSNTRDVAAAATSYAVWLSTDPTLSPSTDTLLRTLPLTGLAAFQSRVEGRRFDVPATLVDGGLYYVIIQVDSPNTVVEFSDSNNLAISELVVTPRCAADGAEPNNFSFEPADAATFEDTPLTSCGDDDWFEFTAPTAGNYVARIDFLHRDGDLNLAVYRDGAATPLAISDSITDNEQVSFSAAAGETLLLRIDAFYNDTASYTLSILP